MIRKMIGGLLIFVASVVIWLFPALVTPRHSRPYDGQDLMQYHNAEMAKAERSQRLALWVCVPAGVVLGIGLCIFNSGIKQKEKRAEHAGGG